MICGHIAREKYDYADEPAKFFQKKVTKKGSQANKNGHFVDKMAWHVNGGLLCVDACNTSVEAKSGRVWSKKRGFVDSQLTYFFSKIK